MFSLFMILCFASFHSAISQMNDYYEVMGITCQANEEVSCLRIKCSNTNTNDYDYCPAARYCYNPECVCRRGYRRGSNGLCVPKKQ
ncbi:uncharacterized protein [Drosophila tropicalis]|uniref:uncharacterized protein n=1 Tax=Drosophila tropicalis TaxID=46794 RepID=UPI0035ABE12C